MLGSNVLFSATDGTHGAQLWVTDGHAGNAHTHSVFNLGP